MVSGTHAAEELVVRGVLAAHQGTFAMAGTALRRLSDRLGASFPANDLHQA